MKYGKREKIRIKEEKVEGERDIRRKIKGRRERRFGRGRR